MSETFVARFESIIRAKAADNVLRWGAQDMPTLILAMIEELGELAQAHLQSIHEGGDRDRIYAELADLGALVLQGVASFEEERDR